MTIFYEKISSFSKYPHYYSTKTDFSQHLEKHLVTFMGAKLILKKQLHSYNSHPRHTKFTYIYIFSFIGSIVLAFGISSARLFANKDRGSFWRCANTLFGSAVLSRSRRDLRLRKGTYVAKNHNANLTFNSSIDIDFLCSPASSSSDESSSTSSSSSS